MFFSCNSHWNTNKNFIPIWNNILQPVSNNSAISFSLLLSLFLSYFLSFLSKKGMQISRALPCLAAQSCSILSWKKSLNRQKTGDSVFVKNINSNSCQHIFAESRLNLKRFENFWAENSWNRFGWIVCFHLVWSNKKLYINKVYETTSIV